MAAVHCVAFALFLLSSAAADPQIGIPQRALLQSPAASPPASAASSASLPAPQTLAGSNATLGDSQETFTVGVQAYLWGYPLVSFWKLLAKNGYYNKFVFSTNLVSNTSPVSLTPNVDTVYGSAPYYLPGNSDGLVLSYPNFGSRYFSFAYIDAYSNNFYIAGTRTLGGNANTILLVGPSFNGTATANITKIQSPTTYGILFVRYLVYSDSDIANVLALQNQTTLVSLSQYLGQGSQPLPNPPNITQPPSNLSTSLQVFDWFARALGPNPPPIDNGALVTLWQQIGVSNGTFNSSALSANGITGLSQAQAAGNNAIAAFNAASLTVNYWLYPNLAIGNFGNNFVLRAATAVTTYLALPPEEAVYFSTSQDSTGALLYGSNSYILNLVPPPNKAFWCLIVYNATNLFLPYGQSQYEITNRTGPLPNQNSNGSYTIFVQPTPPANGSIWLPTPANTPLYFILRAYLPPVDQLVPSIYAPAPFVRYA